MTIHRRDLLAGIGGIAATAALNRLGAQIHPPAEMPAAPVEFPRKADFVIDEGYTYINAAYTHPIPKVSLEAARRAAESRGSLHIPAAGGRGGRGGGAQTNNPKALFAELINAKPTEIAYVPSTSFGENLVGRAENPGAGGRVLLVGDPGPDTRVVLDEHRVAGRGQRPDARRDEADPIFVVLDLPGKADDHAPFSSRLRGSVLCQWVSIWAFWSFPEKST